MPVLAEDLGDIDQPVIDLRSALGFPGMAVLQFAFEPAYADNTHDPPNLDGRPSRLHRHPRQRHRRRLVGRAAASTAASWSAGGLARATGVGADGDREPSWAMIELALGATAGLAMMQAQDVPGPGLRRRG